MNIDQLKNILKKQTARAILKWSKPQRLNIFIMCMLNVILAGIGLGTTLATKGIIDGATAHNREEVQYYALALVLCVIISRGSYLLLGLMNVKTGNILLKNMRSMFLHKLLKKQYESLDGVHSGELVNRMFSDITIVKDGVMEIPADLAHMTVGFIGASLILISIDWKLIVLIAVGSLLGLALIIIFRKPLKNRHRKVQEAEGKLHSVLQEALENIRLIKASGLEKKIEQQTEEKQKRFFYAQLNKGYFSVYMGNGINMAFQTSWLICMLWGCYGLYTKNLTYGMLAALIQLIGQIQGPIADAAGMVSRIYGMLSSAERLEEILDLPEEAEIVEQLGEDEKLMAIQLQDLTFSYKSDGAVVLHDLNLNIEAGDFVAVTGASGSGKSTLFQLLLGIYKPDAGSVNYLFKTKSGEVRRKTATRNTRKLFAYVPQGNTLFSGTLRENLLMFNENVSEEEMKNAVKTACIDHLIDQLEDGLDTLLGERGVGLSEGQAQRVAVARALLSHAPILLLDESTSALDEETEARLLSNISQLKNKTCLIVTHRKAALAICDYELHIENGKVLRRSIK